MWNRNHSNGSLSRGVCILLALGLALSAAKLGADEPQTDDMLQLAVFHADATPPLGSPVAYAAARKIEDPLTARGIVLLGAGQPIVLCAVDWIGIGNGGHDVWREQLDEAAGTTRDRVAVHALHQHDGVRCDFTAEELLAAEGLAGRRFDIPFLRRTIENAAQAMKPNATIGMAAYGDYGPGYIGTEIAYSQGGYETQPSASNVSPEVERILMEGMRRLLRPVDQSP